MAWDLFIVGWLAWHAVAFKRHGGRDVFGETPNTAGEQFEQHKSGPLRVLPLDHFRVLAETAEPNPCKIWVCQGPGPSKTSPLSLVPRK
jgi:hypothetical protein